MMAAWTCRTVLVATLSAGASAPHIARAQSVVPLSEVPGSVLVHIDSPAPVDLQRETGDRRDPFYVACQSPCDEWVPATGRYRIAGSGTRASRRFELLATAGHEAVVVSPASSTAFGVGAAVVVLGAVAFGIGALALVFSALPTDDPNPSPPDNGRRDLVIGLFAGGLIAEAGGIPLVVLNASSRVRQTVPDGPRAAGWPLLRLTF